MQLLSNQAIERQLDRAVLVGCSNSFTYDALKIGKGQNERHPELVRPHRTISVCTGFIVVSEWPEQDPSGSFLRNSTEDSPG